MDFNCIYGEALMDLIKDIVYYFGVVMCMVIFATGMATWGFIIFYTLFFEPIDSEEAAERKNKNANQTGCKNILPIT